jgi:hypothetical protein
VREYAKVGPKFWNGSTGKALRKAGAEALVVGLYLMTSPHSNMLGLYYQPVLYMAHETGLGIEGARKGLQRAIECGFCQYDDESETVWVMEMARYQIAEQLSSKDKQCAGIQKAYDQLPDNPFLEAFFIKYQHAFHLSNRRVGSTQPSGFLEAPSEPLRSQEQEQEIEQEQEKTFGLVGESADQQPAAKPDPVLRCQPETIVALYHEVLPELPKAKLMTDKRRRALATFWRWVLTSKKTDGTPRASTADQALTWIRQYFERARANDFLMGRTQRHGEHANWRCDIDFLLTERGMKHVIEKTVEAAT